MIVKCFRCKTEIDVTKGTKVKCPKCGLEVHYHFPVVDKKPVKHGLGVPSPTEKRDNN